MFNILINCGPAEEYIGECISSVLSQTVQSWQAFVTIDPAGDSTPQRAIAASGGDPRIHIQYNSRWLGPMVNTIQALRCSEAAAEDVIVILDGDDKFATRDALCVIEKTYRDFDCWVTYGSWVSDLSDGEGLWPAYPDGLNNFRGHRWLGTAVRTWKRWLWDLIDDSDFRDATGRYFAVGEDQAILLPMLEMSGARARHIAEALMIYTRSSPHRVCYTRDEESRRNSAYITTLPPYRRLMERPSVEDAQILLSERKRLRQNTAAPIAAALCPSGGLG